MDIFGKIIGEIFGLPCHFTSKIPHRLDICFMCSVGVTDVLPQPWSRSLWLTSLVADVFHIDPPQTYNHEQIDKQALIGV
jgi:hypothetical protein